MLAVLLLVAQECVSSVAIGRTGMGPCRYVAIQQCGYRNVAPKSYGHTGIGPDRNVVTQECDHIRMWSHKNVVTQE